MSGLFGPSTWGVRRDAHEAWGTREEVWGSRHLRDVPSLPSRSLHPFHTRPSRPRPQPARAVAETALSPRRLASLVLRAPASSGTVPSPGASFPRLRPFPPGRKPPTRRNAGLPPQDRVAGDLLEQRFAALPAEGGAARVGGAAGGAGAGGGGLLHAEDPFDLVQFGVGVLELGGAVDEDLDPDAVADRHLVGEAAEVPLELGDAGDQLLAAPFEVDDELLALVRAEGFAGRRTARAHGGARHRRRCAGRGRADRSRRSACAGRGFGSRAREVYSP